jgi:hypothetical protein
MPSTVVPGVVLDAGASCAPASSGMNSGPGFWAEAVAAVEVVPVAPCVDAVVLVELEPVALAELEELELLLLPHAAHRQAASSAATVQDKRAGIAAPNGSERPAPPS